MGELPQYHIGQLARRLAGAYLTPKAEHLKTMVANIEAGRFKEGLDELKTMDLENLKSTYQDREQEPAVGGEDWTPKENKYL
jgi:hypothetical protein